MDSEYDSAKSAANLEKHGIDFKTAQSLWLDSNAVEVPARSTNELRLLQIGMIVGKHWSAIFTRRDDNIRIISVRRAREKEITLYESL